MDGENTRNELEPEQWTSGLVRTSIFFALGVFGNVLAITWLIWHVHRRPYILSAASSAHSSSVEARNSNRSKQSRWSRMTASFVARRGRENPGQFRTLLLALLCMDLTGTLVTSPMTLHLYTNKMTVHGTDERASCLYSSFAMMFFGIATMALLTAMAIERVLSMQFPFYRVPVTSKRARISIAVILCSCAIFCSLPAAGVFSVKVMYPGTWCFANMSSKLPGDKAFAGIYASFGILLILITVLCNIISVVAVVKMRFRNQKVYPPCCHRPDHETQNIIQVSVITCIYVICWTPLMVRIFVNVATETPNEELDRTAIWMATVHPILDPWVYILFRKWALELLKLLFKAPKCVVSACFPVRETESERSVAETTVPLQEINFNEAGTPNSRREEICGNSDPGPTTNSLQTTVALEEICGTSDPGPRTNPLETTVALEEICGRSDDPEPRTNPVQTTVALVGSMESLYDNVVEHAETEISAI